MDFVVEYGANASLGCMSLKKLFHATYLISGRDFSHGLSCAKNLAPPNDVDVVIEATFLDNVGLLDHIY